MDQSLSLIAQHVLQPGSEVAHTAELDRILGLRPRESIDAAYLDLIEQSLRAGPIATMRLRPTQALALLELGCNGGLVAPMRVGSGKTLITALAPVVTFARRPLLLVPAKLVNKTQHDFELLRGHWDVPRFIRIMSYEWLGRTQAAESLEAYQPDLIIADEAHKLKNPKAAVTRRVARYMRAHPDTGFVALSGTITKRSLHDYAHLTRWAFGDRDSCPVPRSFPIVADWADAIDERKGQTKRTSVGALRQLCTMPDERETLRTDPKRAVRLAFRRRFTSTPGVVATVETGIDASLVLEPFFAPESKAIDDAFLTLRRRWETPDGWPISDAVSLYRHARELALGLYYVWNPRPPDDWLEVRRVWCKLVRHILSSSRTLDSELQVIQALDASPNRCPELEAWREVKPQFVPNTEPRWICDSVLTACAEYASRQPPTIVWTEQRFFAERLAEISGLSYFGKRGLNTNGLAIEQASPRHSLIASVASNAEGRNLQAWRSNLVTSSPANGIQWEQLLGRTHREGQLADSVSVSVLLGCKEHVGAYMQAKRDAQYQLDATGSPQKLLLADDLMPSDGHMPASGPRWENDNDA